MTNPTYIVRYHCHICGQMHLVSSEFPLPARSTDLYTHPGSPVYPGECGPVCLGKVPRNLREVRL
jgi:hypothetical protein